MLFLKNYVTIDNVLAKINNEVNFVESSQLRRISIIGISVLCLSPVEFFSNKLFENRKENLDNVVIAANEIKLEPNYISNNYEIFNPNIKTASKEIEKLASENKKKEKTESENNLESETTKKKEKEEENTETVVEETVEDYTETYYEPVVEAPVQTTTQVTETTKTTEKKEEVQAQPVVTSNTEIATSLVNYALQFVGNPYSYGGSSLTGGTDCSGFTMSVFANFGYSLPHNAQSQSYLGSYVSLDNLQPGDLIFYGYDGSICHVAIYIGNGRIVHAATSYEGITTASYQIMPIITARRILN